MEQATELSTPPISANKMSLIRISAVIRNPFTGKATTAKALVDTGTILTVVPRRVADELQLPVIGKRRAATAKGAAELDECIGVVEVMGRKAYVHMLVSNDVDTRADRRNNTRNTRTRSRPNHRKTKGSHNIPTLKQ